MAGPRAVEALLGSRDRADSRGQPRRVRRGWCVMTPLEQALTHADRVPVFPCRECEPGRKRPYTGRGFHDATRDSGIIKAWWRQWPAALIGMPTGRVSGRWVLDIDVK